MHYMRNDLCYLLRVSPNPVLSYLELDGAALDPDPRPPELLLCAAARELPTIGSAPRVEFLLLPM